MPSRISGACTPCRSKKQKCSGHHPTCSQCASASTDCTWPEQRKRGPAKGYIEGLESRLHSAESLLLALLPLVSDNTIETAANTLRLDEDEDVDGMGGRRSSPPLLNKKTGLDYWESFPLDTRRNIRKWQYDCEVQSNNNFGRAAGSSNGNTTSRRHNKSPTHSPASGGIASPHGSVSGMSSHNNSFLQQQNSQQMQLQQQHQSQTSHHQQQHQSHSPIHHPMQAGAAQQLLNLSTQGRDQWLLQQQQYQHQQQQQQQMQDSMQLDPNMLQQHQHLHQTHNHHNHPQLQLARSMPPQTAQLYATDMQDGIFW